MTEEERTNIDVLSARLWPNEEHGPRIKRMHSIILLLANGGDFDVASGALLSALKTLAGVR